MEALMSAIVTGGLALVGVIITNMTGTKKIEQQLAVSQAVTDTKLDNLTEEVKKHNNFAARMPVVEEQIKVINHRIADLEHEVHHENNDGK